MVSSLNSRVNLNFSKSSFVQTARHSCREAGIQRHEGQRSHPCDWIPAIPAGMTYPAF